MKDVAVIILTYNAPEYVNETIETLNEVTAPKDRERMEVIVWDNGSQSETVEIVKKLYAQAYIDKVHYSSENLFFAGGNNACVNLASQTVKYYLLLNSDVKIVRADWFSKLFAAKQKGNYAVAAYGCCFNEPKRADGYCYLIDKALYDQNPLDENFQWWWSITKQQASLLKKGFKILSFSNHDKMIIHWGGKSNVDLSKVNVTDFELTEVTSWFDASVGKIDFKLSPDKMQAFCMQAFYLIKILSNKISSCFIRLVGILNNKERWQ